MKIYDNRATVTFSRIEPNKTVLYLGCVGMGKNDVIGGCDNIFGRTIFIKAKVQNDN